MINYYHPAKHLVRSHDHNSHDALLPPAGITESAQLFRLKSCGRGVTCLIFKDQKLFLFTVQQTGSHVNKQEVTFYFLFFKLN